MDKVTGQYPQTTTFLKRKESRSGIEPRSFHLPAYRRTARPNRLTKMLSDENHFNVSLIVRDKVTRQCPCTDHNF